ncbi:unnamed protein product [Cylindrotheca closterium]|uniref:Uncharacterized protein n=1 Tax=Cylindrotheca closterium TaxID=2856 RepID=A0AAD2G0F1_9STRA|nr:unnamed protein product [Cylindrotheca closterium]
MGIAAHLLMSMMTKPFCTAAAAAATRERFATAPTSDEASCVQRPPVGLDYYPSIQAHCPHPPVIDQDQWVADTLVSWFLTNTTQTPDGFYWHSNLTIHRRKKKKNALSPFGSSSLGIFATGSIARGERLVAFPPLDTDNIEMSTITLLMDLLCYNCPSHDDHRNPVHIKESSTTTILADHGTEASAAKDLQQGDELSFGESSLLLPWCNHWLLKR